MSTDSKELSRVGSSITDVGESLTGLGKYVSLVGRLVARAGSIRAGIGWAAAGLGAIWSRTDLAAAWPKVGALIPIVASVLIAVGLTPAVVSAWRWCMGLRPSERFRRLGPEIRRLTIIDSTEHQYETEDERLERWAAERSLAVKLRDFGLTMPTLPQSRIEILVLAEQGKLKEARELFPRQADDYFDPDLPF